MTAQSELWAAVVVSYDAGGLRSLSNPNNRGSNTINTTLGEDASLDIITLFPVYVQVDYDSTDALHVAAGKQAVIALLWRRGGSSTTIAQVKWEEIFKPDGLFSRLRRLGPRARPIPKSNSGVQQRSELISGQTVTGWSDREAYPPHFLPIRRTSLDD